MGLWLHGWLMIMNTILEPVYSVDAAFILFITC